MLRTFEIDNLTVQIHGDPQKMGNAAALAVQAKLNKAILKNGSANLILATGTSQFTFLKALQKKDIEWDKITVFHLDEYVGISEDHPASFRKYLKDRIINNVNPKCVHYLKGDATDMKKEMADYQELLSKHPIDVACIGIGENGHIAFNDPSVADFLDSQTVKIVELEKECRLQQLGEGWFSSLDEVPKYAMTLTIPAILNSGFISCAVPDERKSEAVHNSLFKDISTSCPASILRTHSDTTLYLDSSSASLIKEDI